MDKANERGLGAKGDTGGPRDHRGQWTGSGSTILVLYEPQISSRDPSQPGIGATKEGGNWSVRNPGREASSRVGRERGGRVGWKGMREKGNDCYTDTGCRGFG